MPPRRLAPKLQLLSARQFSCQIIQVLLRIEREVVRLRRLQPVIIDDQVNGCDGNQHADKIATLQHHYAQLVQYLETLPGVLMEHINAQLLIEYTHQYHQIDQSKSHILLCILGL